MNQSQNNTPIWLYEVSKVVKIIETESRKVVPRAGNRRDEEISASWV